MLKSKQNLHDYFPRLNFNHLQRQAKRFVDKFKEIPIKRISLYPYSNEFKLSKYAKYAVLFEVDEKISEEVYRNFEAALSFKSVDDDAEDEKDINELGIAYSFEDVYKNKPKNNFLSEWQFLSHISGKKMPREIMIKEPHWVLFPEKDFQNASSQNISTEKPEFESEQFIRKLKVYYENDDQIKIQESGKMAKCVTSQSLGLRDNKTKTWKTFITILQDYPHTYCIGPAYENFDGIRTRILSYDTQRKLLDGINKKLINFLNKHYSLQIPHNFKLYERCKDEEPGTYKFKFQVMKDDVEIKSTFEKKYEKFSKKKLIDHLSQMLTEYSTNIGKDYLKPKINACLKVLETVHGMTKIQVRDFINPNKD